MRVSWQGFVSQMVGPDLLKAPKYIIESVSGQEIIDNLIIQKSVQIVFVGKCKIPVRSITVLESISFTIINADLSYLTMLDMYNLSFLKMNGCFFSRRALNVFEEKNRVSINSKSDNLKIKCVHCSINFEDCRFSSLYVMITAVQSIINIDSSFFDCPPLMRLLDSMVKLFNTSFTRGESCLIDSTQGGEVEIVECEFSYFDELFAFKELTQLTINRCVFKDINNVIISNGCKKALISACRFMRCKFGLRFEQSMVCLNDGMFENVEYPILCLITTTAKISSVSFFSSQKCLTCESNSQIDLKGCSFWESAIQIVALYNSILNVFNCNFAKASKYGFKIRSVNMATFTNCLFYDKNDFSIEDASDVTICSSILCSTRLNMITGSSINFQSDYFFNSTLNIKHRASATLNQCSFRGDDVLDESQLVLYNRCFDIKRSFYDNQINTTKPEEDFYFIDELSPVTFQKCLFSNKLFSWSNNIMKSYKSDDKSHKLKCMNCKRNPATKINSECGHVIVCDDCLKNYNPSTNCPICEGIVGNFVSLIGFGEECGICQSYKNDRCFLPCGHCTCRECCLKCVMNTGRCPICNTESKPHIIEP